ncbi:MAG: glycosyltransferase family 2 protein [Gemmatimonadota bacterium]|nr:MAG: glycosyltransferase family 2 protein [Gemmatimonadota bacterium]
MRDIGWTALLLVNSLALVYFALLNSTSLLTSLAAYRSLRRYAQRLKTVDVLELLRSGAAQSITVVAPAYNEEATCVEATRSLLTLEYPEYEILVVNDGSKDATLERLSEAFDLAPAPRFPAADIPSKRVRGTYRSTRYPYLWVIDKENGGKADAINAGLNFVRTPLFCTIDSDSLLEPEALLRVSRPFLEDARTIAAGGIVRIVNGSTVWASRVMDVRLPRSMLARLQVLEYLRAFHSGRLGWAELNATMIISGAFGLFKRSVVVEAGGFASGTVGEDMELVVRLHRHCHENGIPYRIVYIPDPVAWTECPETVKGLRVQRDRWQRGLTEVLTRNLRLLFNPSYGSVGFLAFPYFFFLEMLGPVIEVVGYIAFAVTIFVGLASLSYVLAFLMLAILFGIALSIAVIGLEELTFRRYHRTADLARLFWLAIAENFGYRQLNSLWRIKGMISFLRGRHDWGELTRKGFATSD